ncbi:MAG: MBL fold metallo-hydrolase [Candidatus Dadabacteria bacterium]|nr:MBL fold metallo-hydrolase [Candidatus Dadabacteria bacterium]
MYSAPSLDEVEISIFGPGYGESILCHLGNNCWIIIDSCIDPDSKQPYTLTYLKNIGVNTERSVRHIIATHWHDDHIRGLGFIVEECKSADFICSEALKSNEFLTLVSACGKRSMMTSSGVAEFYKILQTLIGYKPQRIPSFAIEDRCLKRILPENSALGLPCEIHSLSPSDYSVLLTKIEIANLIPKEKTTKRRVLEISPNHLSVVLLIIIGDLCILLGSDLEEIGNAQTGWTKIVNSQSRPIKKASLFKIPHHGSKNADLQDVWTEMLNSKPIAVLTPFAKGNVYLPTKNDVTRICSRTENAYVTAIPRWRKSRTRPSTVEKTIRESGIKIKQYNQTLGQIRIRTKPTEGNNFTLDLFGEALKLKDVSQFT